MGGLKNLLPTGCSPSRRVETLQQRLKTAVMLRVMSKGSPLEKAPLRHPSHRDCPNPCTVQRKNYRS